MYIPVSFCPICLKMTNVTFCRDFFSLNCCYDFLSLTYCHVTFCPTFKLWTTHLVKKYWTKDRNTVSLKPLIGTLTTRLSAEDCFRQWTKRERKDIDNLSGWFGLVYGVYHHFQQYFSYTVTVSFIGGGNWSTRRKPPTCRKSLTNFITLCCIGYTSPWAGFKLTTLVVIGTDYTGSCKSKHHTQHIRNGEHLKI
jgi:hypothetical protein